MIKNQSVCSFLLTIILCYHHPYASCNHKDTNREEEPEEPLGIVTKKTQTLLNRFFECLLLDKISKASP